MEYQPRELKFYHCDTPAVGGIVYHGENLTELNDLYVFADSAGNLIYTHPQWNKPKILYASDLSYKVIGTNKDHSRIFLGTDSAVYELDISQV